MFGLYEIVPIQRFTVASKTKLYLNFFQQTQLVRVHKYTRFCIADKNTCKIQVSMHFDQGLGGLFIRNQVVDQTGFQSPPDGVDLFLTAADQKNLVDPFEIIRRDANDNIILL